MNEIQRHGLLCFVRIDLAEVGDGNEGYGDALFATAVPAGPLCWEGLLEVGSPRETDEREYGGYVMKAWVLDHIAGRHCCEMEWIDPCHDQWERILGYLYDWPQRVGAETGT